MTVPYTIELIGGDNDGTVLGTVLATTEDIIKTGLVLPREPEIGLVNYWDSADEFVTYTTELWQWDGTVTESGTYRFRLAS